MTYIEPAAADSVGNAVLVEGQERVIALYVAVSRKAETAKRARPSGFKQGLGRLVDIVRALLPLRPKIRFHVWGNGESNKGDIAIREEVRRELATVFLPEKVTFLEYSWEELDDEAISTINARADLFVIGGSGYFFPRKGVLPQRLSRDADAIAQIACPKVAYSVGWNALLAEDAPLNEAGRHTMARLVRELDLISVRGAHSADRVAAASGVIPKVTLDPVLYGLHERAPQVPQRTAGRKLRIGVNIACHGPVSAARVCRDIDRLATVLKELKAQYGAELHFLSHCASDRIVWWMLLGRGVYMRFRDAPASEMPSIYEGLDVVLAEMMHSTIFSIGVGVPVVATAYDVKSFGLFDLMDMTDFIVSVADWTESDLLSRMRRAIADRDTIRERMNASRARVASANREFLQALPALVRAKPVR